MKKISLDCARQHDRCRLRDGHRRERRVCVSAQSGQSVRRIASTEDPEPSPESPATRTELLRIPTVLMSCKDICHQLRMSRSHWLQLVHDGDAPSPSIRLPRFTRWATADVLGWVSAQQARGGDMRSGASAPVACTTRSHDARGLCGSASAVEPGKRVEQASAAPASDVRGFK